MAYPVNCIFYKLVLELKSDWPSFYKYLFYFFLNCIFNLIVLFCNYLGILISRTPYRQVCRIFSLSVKINTT